MHINTYSLINIQPACQRYIALIISNSMKIYSIKIFNSDLYMLNDYLM